MLFRKKQIDEEIKSMQAEVKRLPKGKLVCVKNSTRVKWYQSDGHNQVYIPKDKRELADKLARKKYLTIMLDAKIKEQKAMERHLKCRGFQTHPVQQFINEKPAYSELLSPYIETMKREHLEWMNEAYKHNDSYPENLIYKIGNGKCVRSKSEAMIAMLLHVKKIPYRYECALTINGVDYYPDFTIMHPKTDKIYYFEHFGKMDDAIYSTKTMNKLAIYIENGIIPNVNLIATFETKECPLDMVEVEKILDFFFGEEE